LEFKKIKLGTEERKRLLQMMAEEEQRLGSQDLSEEELAEEERLLSEKLGQLLAAEAAKDSGSKDEKELVKVPSQSAQSENWQVLKQKIDNLSLSSETGGLLTNQESDSSNTIPFSRKPIHSRQNLSSTRKYQVGILLVAAAVLMMVYVLVPQAPLTGPSDPSDFSYKGTAADPSVTQLGPDHLICNYRVILRSKNDSATISEAVINNDQANYLVGPDQLIQVASKCLANNAYVHGMFVPNQGLTSRFYNQKLVANQWNLVPSAVNEQWVLGSSEGRIIMFMTVDKIDESQVNLPTDLATSIGSESVVEFQEIALKLDQK